MINLSYWALIFIPQDSIFVMFFTVLSLILHSRCPEKLLELSNIKDIVQGLLPYTGLLNEFKMMTWWNFSKSCHCVLILQHCFCNSLINMFSFICCLDQQVMHQLNWTYLFFRTPPETSESVSSGIFEMFFLNLLFFMKYYMASQQPYYCKYFIERFLSQECIIVYFSFEHKFLILSISLNSFSDSWEKIFWGIRLMSG